MTLFQTTFLIAFAVSSLTGVFFWSRAKFLLRERGFPISFSQRGHMKDLFYMKELAHSERNPARRKRIQRLRTCMVVFLVASVVLLGILSTSLASALLSQP